MNIADIIIILLIAAAVFFAVRKMRKNKGGCSCGCSNCEQSCSAKKSDGQRRST